MAKYSSIKFLHKFCKTQINFNQEEENTSSFEMSSFILDFIFSVIGCYD